MEEIKVKKVRDYDQIKLSLVDCVITNSVTHTTIECPTKEICSTLKDIFESLHIHPKYHDNFVEFRNNTEHYLGYEGFNTYLYIYKGFHYEVTTVE